MYSDPRQAFAIPEENFPAFVKKMKSLSRRAAKLGVGEISFGECGEKFSAVKCGGEVCKPESGGCSMCRQGVARYERAILVQVYGDKPILPGGYELAARIEPLSDGVNLIHVVPGYAGPQIPVEYREAANRCDHCATKRRRKDLFAVVSAEGEFQLVGRNCLRDFTGIGQGDPEAVAKFAQYLFDAFAAANEPGGAGGHDPAYDAWPILAFFAQVAALIRIGGWISKGAAGFDDVPTADLACQAFTPPYGATPAARAEWAAWVKKVAPNDGDNAEAEAAHEWVLELEADNDYLYNIQALSQGDYAMRRHAGYLASVVSSYARQRDRLRLAELERQRLVRQGSEAEQAGHFGEVDKRVEVEVELVESPRWFSNNFGQSALHSLVTAEGHRLKWWASEGAAGKADLKVGGRYRVKLTPKEHGDYRDVPETKVARLSVVEALGG